MQILFVVDQFPYPPRNGVTIPIANYASRLAAAGAEVDILWFDLERSGESLDSPQSVRELIRVPMRRRGLATAAAAECIGAAPLFAAWAPEGALPRLSGRQYDLVWASPIRSFGLWLKYRELLGAAADRTWAVINDSYALTLLDLGKRHRTCGARLLARVRARGMRRIEPKLLANADVVAVQSAREMDYFRKIFGTGQGPRLLELKNGVADTLLERPRKPRIDLLFVGVLDAIYKSTLDWFIRDVYLSLPDPKPSFVIIGKGADDGDRRQFERLSIQYHSFVDDIGEFYAASRIVVAPIFKGYGLINKVLEGMAAGCVVIGDPTAFNGIDNFRPGRDGIVATVAEEFVAAIVAILSDSEAAERIGVRARDVMRRDFSWDSRVEDVLEVLGPSVSWELGHHPGRKR